MADILFIIVSSTAVIQCILSTIFIIGLIFRLKKNEKKVCVIVLGDIGRSPRMQYHATSFVKESFSVDIVGLKGSHPLNSLKNNKFVKFIYLIKLPLKPSYMPGIIYYILKTAFQFFQLMFILIFVVEKPGHFLIQNPPSIPTIAATWLVCCIKGSRLIIDWHNYGYTILSLNLKSDRHPLVLLSKVYEEYFGRKSWKNICVTQAMKVDLETKWGIKSSVLYDRPPAFFKKLSIEEKHKLFMKYSKDYIEFKGEDSNSTVCTQSLDGDITLKRNRSVVLLSSTSWTDDEDFSLLLNALETYNESKKKSLDYLPNILCIITGKGPLKEYYKNIIVGKKFEHVSIITPWLSSEDYPKIIGSGDLGICLHTSSSGLDLPMKVVDMFGCGLPVSAVRFSCLHELVKENENGLMFDTSAELAEQLIDLFSYFSENTEKLDKMRMGLASFQNNRWHDNWKNVLLPLLEKE